MERRCDKGVKMGRKGGRGEKGREGGDRRIK